MKQSLEDFIDQYNLDRKFLKLKNNPSLFFKDFYKKRTVFFENIKFNSNLEPSNDQSDVAVQRVAISENGTVFFERLKKICNEFNVDYMLGAALDQWMYGIHVEKKDLSFFLKIIHEWLNSDDIYIKVKNENYTVDQFLNIRTNDLRAFDILVKEIDGNKVKYCSYIHVMLWQKLDNYSIEKIYTILEDNKYVHRLREGKFKDLMTNKSRLNDQSNASDVKFPIDIVYTWVDGDDLEWKKQKNKYQGKTDELRENIAGRANSDERFRNRNELLYSLRSIELFAPFVRNIYIVTAGQKPDWINLSNPKIKIVDHKEIYRDKACLPTFNSSGIETQLHHIEGLAEHFLYLNDDFMFADFCTPEDFFYTNGKIKFFPSEARAYEDDIDETREEYLIADGNVISLMMKEHGINSRFIMKHAPYPCKKSYLYELEERYQAEFNACASNRFRAATDIRPIAFMQFNFGFIEGQAIPSDISNRYLALYKPNIKAQFNGVVKTRKYKTICINDVGLDTRNLQAVNELTTNFLESYYFVKSKFEK